MVGVGFKGVYFCAEPVGAGTAGAPGCAGVYLDAVDAVAVVVEGVCSVTVGVCESAV